MYESATNIEFHSHYNGHLQRLTHSSRAAKTMIRNCLNVAS